MKLFKLTAAALIAVIFASCGTYTYNESTARFVQPSRAGFITPVTADMDVRNDRIENQVEIPVVLKKKEITAIMAAEYRGQESPLVLSWKKYALSQTLKKYKADDIISPNFDIAPHPAKANTLLVTVSGHPAVYKNYRPATKEDVELIKPFIEQKNDITVGGGLILQRYK